MTLRQQFAANLHRLRLLRDLTQAELAERAGVTQNTISLFELQKASPTLDTIEALAKALRCPPAALLAAKKSQLAGLTK